MVGLRWSWAAAMLVAAAVPAWSADVSLRMPDEGSFKVVMFSDVHDDEEMDPRTAALMGAVLDTERPGMVVIGGDCVWGAGCESAPRLRRAIANVAKPMEDRSLPWAITFGNHDQEHQNATHLDKRAVMAIYESYSHNVNSGWERGISGVGNKRLLIAGRTGKPVFALWLIDSQDYAPKSIGGYGWIRSDQVDWYRRTSLSLEERYGAKIPGLMFFHIPLKEFGEMYAEGKTQGDKFEAECPAAVNSGLFAAVLERGDVKGIFCGHDHVNNYVGEWKGVKLGYDGSVGFATYSLPSDHPKAKQSRGGRVFVIDESSPSAFKTWMRFEDGSTGP